MSKRSKITTLDQIDETHFWSHQFMEHALFLHLGLENEQLKKQALDIHDKLKAFNDEMMSRGVDEHKLRIDNEDVKKLEGINFDKIYDMVDELARLKRNVLIRLEKGEWLGWLWQSFVRHILMESDYFILKVNGLINSKEIEIGFWNQINSEHIGMNGQLLDPDFENDELIKQASELSHEFMNLGKGEQLQLLSLSKRYAETLDKFHRKAQEPIVSGKISSIIHPTLIEHVIREGQRSIYVLNNMN